MDVEIRRLRPGEELAFVKSVRVPFLHPASGHDRDDRWMERAARGTEADRSWVAEVAGRFVGNCGIDTLDVTVPAAPGLACPVVPMAGVTSVGVYPTHRRKGLLTRMMAEMVADARARGEPLAGLIASEAGIYGRFGFGLATEAAELEIDTREAAMLKQPPTLALELLDKDEAAKILPGVFDAQRRDRAGEPCRSAIKWEDYIDDPPERRNGGNPLFVAACDDGYVSYRAVEGRAVEEHRGAHRARIVVEELRGATAEVEAGLWQFVFGVDLADRVTARRRPVDEPLRWRLADPRQLRLAGVSDRLHVRVVGMQAAFGARGYRSEGRLVVDVVVPPSAGGADDPAAGTWVIEAGPDGCSCRAARPGDDPDLRLDLAALGSLYMGAFPVSLLAAAGRVEELRRGGLALADRMLVTRPSPLTRTGF